MFGLTRREQYWKASQRAAETMVTLATAVVQARAEIAVAGAQADADELKRLRADNALLREMLRRYRTEVPLGHQPHMLAHTVDEALYKA